MKGEKSLIGGERWANWDRQEMTGRCQRVAIEESTKGFMGKIGVTTKLCASCLARECAGFSDFERIYRCTRVPHTIHTHTLSHSRLGPMQVYTQPHAPTLGTADTGQCKHSVSSLLHSHDVGARAHYSPLLCQHVPMPVIKYSKCNQNWLQITH